MNAITPLSGIKGHRAFFPSASIPSWCFRDERQGSLGRTLQVRGEPLALCLIGGSGQS